MARSKFNWLIVYEDGETQFAKAQTIYQIINCGGLTRDSDCIISITKMDISDSYNYTNTIDIKFQD